MNVMNKKSQRKTITDKSNNDFEKNNELNKRKGIFNIREFETYQIILI